MSNTVNITASNDTQAQDLIPASRDYTPLQRHFLLRLAQVVTLHERVDTWPSMEELLRLLVGAAIYSTLRDCEEAGAGDVAREIVADGSWV